MTAAPAAALDTAAHFHLALISCQDSLPPNRQPLLCTDTHGVPWSPRPSPHAALENITAAVATQLEAPLYFRRQSLHLHPQAYLYLHHRLASPAPSHAATSMVCSASSVRLAARDDGHVANAMLSA